MKTTHGVSRRQFIAVSGMVATAGAFAGLTFTALPAAGRTMPATASPVVTIWMGLPALDFTGREPPYVPACHAAGFCAADGDPVEHPAWDYLW